jgi:YgiT-type zinc finger domain-containing protein
MAVAWDEATWDALAAEAFLGIKEWRRQHPKATFTEIEQALDTQLGALRARMLQDVAPASAAAAVRAAGAEDRPPCPACGGALAARGGDTRAVTVAHGQTVALTRSYAVCPACGAGLFPPR